MTETSPFFQQGLILKYEQKRSAQTSHSIPNYQPDFEPRSITSCSTARERITIAAERE
jgi:hypothetical protein